MELPKELYSYPVQKKVCREAIRSSYDEIGETLKEYTGSSVPKRQRIEIISRVSKDFDDFYLQKSENVSKKDILVISADGKGVVMRKESL